MTEARRPWFWLIVFVVATLFVYMLRGMLLPFVVGMALAYFLDPVADRLERLGLSRILATSLIVLLFFLILAAVVVLLGPVVQAQVMEFISNVPKYANALNQRLSPLMNEAMSHLSDADVVRAKTAAGEFTGTAVGWLVEAVKGVLTGGWAVVNALSLLIITPVVTFYLLRDWDTMTSKVDKWLPLDYAATIREQLRLVNQTLAGFVRGQAMSCMAQSIFDAIALTAVGLNLGLVIGLATGIMAFVPYVGMVIGLVTSVALAIAQGPDWSLMFMVLGVFAVGNVIEGYALTPKLVGDRIGLHPVWIMFSLFAGGTLAGFLGMLLAVPVAAVVGVMVRFVLSRYLASDIYLGNR